jgi:hypothetical protein
MLIECESFQGRSWTHRRNALLRRVTDKFKKYLKLARMRMSGLKLDELGQSTCVLCDTITVHPHRQTDRHTGRQKDRRTHARTHTPWHTRTNCRHTPWPWHNVQTVGMCITLQVCLCFFYEEEFLPKTFSRGYQARVGKECQNVAYLHSLVQAGRQAGRQA